MILYQALIDDFELIPYVRMTRRGKWINKRAKEYISNQDQLAWLLLPQKNADVNYPIIKPCKISYRIYRKGRLADDDNCRKALQDALQKAGIIKNDFLIIGCLDSESLHRQKVSRVVVKLEKR